MVGGATSEGGNVPAWCRQVLRLPAGAALEAALAALPAAGHGLSVPPHLARQPAPSRPHARPPPRRPAPPPPPPPRAGPPAAARGRGGAARGGGREGAAGRRCSPSRRS